MRTMVSGEDWKEAKKETSVEYEQDIKKENPYKELDSIEVREELCPSCRQRTLILTERIFQLPYFGKAHLFSMQCTNCGFFVADIELEQKAKKKYSFEVTGPEDLYARVVKSSQARIKIPRLIEITPGTAAESYITNVEGLLRRIKAVLEREYENAETKEEKKEIWKKIKKINNVLVGRDKLKIILEDPSGNSAIFFDNREPK